MIYVDGKGNSFSREIEIRGGTVWIKILKKENFKEDPIN